MEDTIFRNLLHRRITTDHHFHRFSLRGFSECCRTRGLCLLQAVHHFRARMHFQMAQQYREVVWDSMKLPRKFFIKWRGFGPTHGRDDLPAFREPFLRASLACASRFSSLRPPSSPNISTPSPNIVPQLLVLQLHRLSFHPNHPTHTTAVRPRHISQRPTNGCVLPGLCRWRSGPWNARS